MNKEVGSGKWVVEDLNTAADCLLPTSHFQEGNER